MKDIKELFTSLYNDFLLRDLFAKIVPGMVVISIALLLISPGQDYFQVFEKTSGLIVFLLIGISWTIGYAIQQVGELTRLIMHHPKRYNHSKERYSLRLRFSDLATKSELQQVERFAVIKEATGNLATALLFGVVAIFFRNWSNIVSFSSLTFLVPVVILLFFAFALITSHRSHSKKQYSFIENVIDLRSEIKAVVFDFDGVIVDSMQAQAQAWQKAIDECKDELDSLQSEGILENFWSGKSGTEIFSRLNIHSETQRKLRSMKDEAWEKTDKTLQLFEGAEKTLKTLSAKYTLAIATSAPRKYVEYHLERNNIRGLFSMILTNADVKNPKPSPDLLKSIARTLQIQESGIVMIGDTENDAEMAEKAGCKFYLFCGHIYESSKPARVRLLADWSFLGKELAGERTG